MGRNTRDVQYLVEGAIGVQRESGHDAQVSNTCGMLQVVNRSSQELVQHFVVLVRQVRTQHIACEDDLSEDLLHV